MDTFTPSCIPCEPYANKPKPIAIMINPNPYFTAAGGLNLESQIFETVEAKAIIKNEFKIENHDGSISDAVFLNSLFNIHIATAHTPKNVIANIILDAGAFLRSEERRVGKECRYRWLVS